MDTGANKGAARRRRGEPGPEPPAAERPALSPKSRVEQLEEQLRVLRDIGGALSRTVGLDQLLEQMVPLVSKLMRAERTTLFFYDEVGNELWSKVAQGLDIQEIRLPMGQGIAGWAAQHRQGVNVTDAYADARFNPDVDVRTGFRTRAVAATPLVNRRGELVGILQVINPESGAFNDEDMALLEAIAQQTTYAVENAQLAEEVLEYVRELHSARHRADRRRAELDLLYQLERETAHATDVDELINSIIVRTCERLRSDAGSVLLLAGSSNQLYFRDATGTNELRRELVTPGEGVVGWVAKSGQPLIVNRPEDDPRHGELYRKLAVPTHALLAVPLVWDQRVMGAVEVRNPRPRPTGGEGYDLEDLKVLTVIAGQIARAVTLLQERQRVIETDRLSVIGTMMAGVAHDLRNPMTVISGYAQLMAAEDDAEKRALRCDQILNQVDEMTAMIADLLAYARGDTELRPASLELKQVATELRETLGMHCQPRGIELTVNTGDGVVWVDVGRVKRILYNLAKNAVDVLGRKDRLTITLQRRDNGLYVEIADSGPGMPAEVRAHLFQPFVTSGKASGTGLGLSIVRRFVDDHGGTIEVESKEGAGTIFRVQLPEVRETGGVA